MKPLPPIHEAIRSLFEPATGLRLELAAMGRSYGQPLSAAAPVALLPAEAGPYRDLCTHCGSITTHSDDHGGLCDECYAEASAEWDAGWGPQTFAQFCARWYGP